MIKQLGEAPSEGSYGPRYVPTVNGKPACPGTGYHIYAVDYDDDGDLDLLVGGQSYYKLDIKQLTPAEQKKLDEISLQISNLQKEMQEFMPAEMDKESMDAVYKDPEFEKLSKKLNSLFHESEKLSPTPQAANRVWLFRNKGNGAVEKTFTSTQNQ